MMDTERIRQEYLRNGVVLLRDLLSAEWVEKIAAGIKKVVPEAEEDDENAESVEKTPARDAGFGRDFGNWRNVPEINEFVVNSPIAKVLADIMGSQSLTFYFDQVLVRPAHDRTLTPFHVEMSSFPFVGDQGISVVVPVDKIPLETCVKFVQGSHLWGKTYYPRGMGAQPQAVGEDKPDQHEHVPDIRSIKNAMVLEWTMTPGDALIYNMKTLQALNGNCTNHVQRSLVTHWFGDDVKFVQRTWPVHPPLTGRVQCGEHPSVDGETFPLVYGQLGGNSGSA